MLPSMDTKALMRGSRAEANRLEIPPQLQLTTATSDKSVSGSDLAYVMRKEMSRACALIPSRSSVISRVDTPIDGLARTTSPRLARYSHRSAFSHETEESLGA